MTTGKIIPSVSVTYARHGGSTRTRHCPVRDRRA